jgi:hypothetical protein
MSRGDFVDVKTTILINDVSYKEQKEKGRVLLWGYICQLILQ